MASTQAHDDAAAQQRILAHMNADHQDSIVRYTEYFKKATPFQARAAKFSDVTLEKATISAGGSSYELDFDPPLESWRQARDRLVQMDREATAGLQRSEITIKEYRAPRGLGAVLFGTCFFTYVLLSRPGNFAPGSLMREYLLDYVPPFRDLAASVRGGVLYSMIGIHLLEVYIMAKTRLRKHTVPLFSGLWWKWSLSTFVEGVGAFMRFDGLVKEKKIEKEKQKH